MNKTPISADTAFTAWREDPDYRAAYEALDAEFTIARQLIEARVTARLSQEQLAERMGTSQAAIARLESGRALPSTRTLERFARATGHRLQIVLTPLQSDDRSAA